MKVGEAISRIQSLYNRGAKADSSRLTDRHVYNMIKSARAMLITQKQSQGQWAYSPISCARIKRVSAAECGCGPSYGVYFFRSTYQVPTPIRGVDYLMSVFTPDNYKEFSQTTWESAKYISASRFSSKEPQWYIKDSYLYVVNNNNIGTLVLNGVWYDPVGAAMYDASERGDCVIAQDVGLGIDPDLWAMVFDIVKSELGMFVNMEEDGTTDSKDRPTK